MSHKISDFPSTTGVLRRLTCPKFVFGRGSAPDPAGGAHDAPPSCENKAKIKWLYEGKRLLWAYTKWEMRWGRLVTAAIRPFCYGLPGRWCCVTGRYSLLLLFEPNNKYILLLLVYHVDALTLSSKSTTTSMADDYDNVKHVCDVLATAL